MRVLRPDRQVLQHPAAPALSARAPSVRPGRLVSRALVTLALVAVCSLTACGPERGGDPLALVPADADNVLVTPPIAELQRASARFLAGIEGTSGLLELVADRFGLDLRTPEGPAALGLDPARGLALYTRHFVTAASDTPGSTVDAHALVIALPVANPGRFLERVALRLERSLGLVRDPSTPLGAAAPARFSRPPTALASDSLEVALGVAQTPTGAVGLLVVASTPTATPVPTPAPAPTPTPTLELWRSVAQAPATPFPGSPRDSRAAATAPPRATAGPDQASLRFAWRFEPPAAPSNLGILRGILDNLLARLSAWEGTLTLSADGLALGMTTAPFPPSPNPEVPPPVLPAAWVNPTEPAPSPLAAAFPRTTTAFIRLRLNLERVRSLPGFVRNNVLPDSLPGLESLPLPSTADLVNLLTGDVAVALLGLDPNARLMDLTSPALLRRPLTVFRVALAARLRDPAAFGRTYLGIAEQLATSGWTVAPIAHASPLPAGVRPWTGWTFVRDNRHFSLLTDGEVAVFVLGEGEVDAFLAVREGRALSLASFADPLSGQAHAEPPPPSPPTPVRALGLSPDGGGALGLLLSPVRLTRELAARSIPPYFLKIINDIRLFSGDLSATPEAATLRLELGL